MAQNAELLGLLEKGAQALHDSLDGVTEAAASKSPGEGRWSILECLEHVAMAEEAMLARLTSAVPAEHSQNVAREQAILTRGPDRGRRIQAPDGTLPLGRFPRVSAAMGYFLEHRAKTAAFVGDCPSDLRSLAATHPLLGPVNGYELVLLMAMHPVRHSAQIREIRSS